jgi:hypothetical protein
MAQLPSNDDRLIRVAGPTTGDPQCVVDEGTAMERPIGMLRAGCERHRSDPRHGSSVRSMTEPKADASADADRPVAAGVVAVAGGHDARACRSRWNHSRSPS